MPTLDELLIYAARGGNEALLRKRIDAGANVNHVSDVHGSALGEAIRNGHLDVVRALVERGADVNMADRFGDGPLEYALYYRHDEIAVTLLRAGARLQPHARETFRALQAECLKRQASRSA